MCDLVFLTSVFHYEQLPVLWNHIVTENSGKWKAIAKYQVKETFNPSERELKKQAQR